MIFLFQRCGIFRLKEVPLPRGRTCPLPLAGTDDVGDGSRITLVECTALCRNEERDERSWRPPMFFFSRWGGWFGWKKRVTFFFVNTSSHFGEKDSQPPIPTMIISSTESTSEVLGVAERGEGDATWLQMMLRCLVEYEKKSSEKSPGSKNHGISKLVCWRCQTPCEQHIQTHQKSQGSVILRAFASQRHMASKLIVKFWIVVFLVVSDMFIDVHCV